MIRTEIFEELLEPLNKMRKENNDIPADEIMKSYNHIYMTMIASSLCNISDKMDELVEMMKSKEDEEITDEDIEEELNRNTKEEILHPEERPVMNAIDEAIKRRF